MEFIIITQNKAVEQVASCLCLREFLTESVHWLQASRELIKVLNTLSKLSLSALGLIIPFFIYSLVCGNCGRQFFLSCVTKEATFHRKSTGKYYS